MNLNVNVKSKILSLLCSTASILSCSTEPSKEAASAGVQIDVGKDDAGINTSKVSGGLSSKDAFALTLFPIVSTNCGGCHGNETAPLFANEDIETALNALEEAKKISRGDVASSRLVKRLSADKHNCWSECEENANEMEDAITEWLRLSETTDEKTDLGGISFSAANTDNACNKVGELIFIEAESGTATNGYVPTTVDDVTFISSSNAANGNAAAAGQPTMSYTVDIANSGYYAIHGRVSVPDNNAQDSFFLKVNDSPFINSAMDQNSDVFGWDAFSQQTPGQISTFFLEKGANTFAIRHREPAIKLDSIVLTTDLSFTSYSDERKIMCFDISEQVGEDSGVYFGFAIEKFSNDSSYKVSKPIVISAKDNLYVEDIDILINGNAVPQNNTYKAVKESFGPGKSPVSNATMIMNIDKGYDQDKFSVRFGKSEYR
ncbi:hypothetical protein N9D31_02835 [Oligoflexaceae bacterium]|nr:hypothetical protein [Oligoflexaceae bacterium]